MDNWRLLSDCLPAWLSAEIEKGAGTEAPASEGRNFINDETTQPATEAATSSAKGRGRATHSPAPPQRSVAGPMLLLINGGLGGGRRQEEETSAAFRASGEEGGPARKLMLVVG